MRHDYTITKVAINLLSSAATCFKAAFFCTAGVRISNAARHACVSGVYMGSRVEKEFMKEIFSCHQGIVQCQLKRAATNKHVAITMIVPPWKMSIQGVAILALSG
jgi:hypothetical protein